MTDTITARDHDTNAATATGSESKLGATPPGGNAMLTPADRNAMAAGALHKATVNYAYLLLKDHLAVDYGYTEHGAHYTDDPETLCRLISETHRIADEIVSRLSNTTEVVRRFDSVYSKRNA
jgi:hypothetical protein